jgi:hypothetical protein
MVNVRLPKGNPVPRNAGNPKLWEHPNPPSRPPKATRPSSGRRAPDRVAGDDNRDMASHSRGAIFARAVPDRSSLDSRGRRESRVPAAPAASCARSIKRTSVVTTGSASSARLSPRNGFNGYFALSPVTGLFCHRRLRNNFRKLDASVGASGPHDFAVRTGAVRQRAAKASIASCFQRS